MSAFRLDTDRTTYAWLATAGLMIAFAVAVAPAALIDERTLWEVNVWHKPLKFCTALIVHFVTLALLAQLLAPKKRAGATMTVMVWLSVAAAAMEMAYIIVQAARGRHSHFNFDTPFEATMYAVMGAGALLLVIAPFVLGVFLAMQRDGDRSGLKLGAIIGLLLAPVLTIVFAGYMSSVVYSHWIGEAASDAGGVPVFGWSREVGDLRPAHFVATHLMQFLPLAGLAADRLIPRAARPAVAVAALLLAGLAAALFAQALAGKPVWPY